MKKIVLNIILYFLVLSLPAQINLVPNGNFHLTTSLPSSSVYSSVPWYEPNMSTPDLFSFNSPLYANIPDNIVGFSYPKIDTNYAGIIIYYSFNGDTSKIYTEYIGTPLTDSLIKGHCYHFTLYYSLADGSRMASNKLGIYLSQSKITSTSTTDTQIHGVIPQIFVDTTTFITDTSHWIPLSGVYQAAGGEQFLTIGNFYTKETTKHKYIKSLYPNYLALWPNTDTSLCYVYIDDVSLYEISKPNLGGDKSVCLQNNTLTIGDATLPNYSLHWYKNDTLLSDTNNVISIHPNYTSTYILQNQGCASDTIVVNVFNNCPTPADPVPNTFTPNDDGINDAWVFSVGSASTKVSCRVYNRWGNLIYQLPNTTPPHTTIHWDGRTNSGEKCNEGVYFYTIEYTNADGKEVREKGYVSLFR